MNGARLKRISIGCVAFIAALLVLDLVPSFLPLSAIEYRLFGYFYFWLAVKAAVAMFVAASIGAYFAQVDFVGPSVLLAAAVWAFTIYFLNSIAAVVGQDDILAVAGINFLGLLFGVGGSAIGAVVGRSFARQKSEDNAVGAT